MHQNENPLKLDKKDKEIIYDLTMGARKPLTTTAKNVGMSEPAVNYRIKNLMEKGVISGFVTITRIDKLGLNMYRCMFRIKRATQEKEKEIIGHFINNRNAFRLHRITGRWDLVADFATRDVSSFFEQVKGVTQRFSDNLGNYHALTLVNSISFNRKYLIGKQADEEQACRFGGKDCRERLDAKDLSILEYISNRGRAMNSEIGKNTDISPGTVKKRLRSMEKRGVIQAYSAFVHPMVFGVLCKRIPLRFYEFSDADKRLLEFAKGEPNVINLEKMTGNWDYELCLECNDQKEFMDTLNKLKETFVDVLYDYEVIDVNYNYNVNLLPPL